MTLLIWTWLVEPTLHHAPSGFKPSQEQAQMHLFLGFCLFLHGSTRLSDFVTPACIRNCLWFLLVHARKRKRIMSLGRVFQK